MKKKSVVVSIIMPYFKKKKYFQKSFNSVLNQTFTKYEIIIIYDDKNKSELNFIKKKIKNKKFIKLILNNKNIGAGLSRNKGINISRGKYIAFLDCDDFWTKDKLEKQIKYMIENNLEFSHTNYFLIGENYKVNGFVRAKKQMLYRDLLKSCDIGLSTVIVEKRLLLKNKFPNLKTKEDYVLWLKLIKNSIKFESINNSLTYWQKSKNSLSSSLFQKLSDAFKVYYLYEKKNIIYSIFCVIRLSVYALLKKINLYLSFFTLQKQ